MTSKLRLAAKAVQATVSSLGKRRLKVDGVIGPITVAAIGGLPPSARAFVLDLARNYGLDLPAFISKQDVEQYATIIGRELGVPLDYILLTVDHENVAVTGGYMIEVDGKYRGLGQFDKRTWESVMSTPYSKVGDPAADITAIAKLYLANKKTYRSQFGTVKGYSKYAGYLYHNQGAGAAEQFLRSGKLRYPKQSRAALKTFASARGSRNEYNPSGSFS